MCLCRTLNTQAKMVRRRHMGPLRWQESEHPQAPHFQILQIRFQSSIIRSGGRGDNKYVPQAESNLKKIYAAPSSHESAWHIKWNDREVRNNSCMWTMGRSDFTSVHCRGLCSYGNVYPWSVVCIDDARQGDQYNLQAQKNLLAMIS